MRGGGSSPGATGARYRSAIPVRFNIPASTHTQHTNNKVSKSNVVGTDGLGAIWDDAALCERLVAEYFLAAAGRYRGELGQATRHRKNGDSNE